MGGRLWLWEAGACRFLSVTHPITGGQLQLRPGAAPNPSQMQACRGTGSQRVAGSCSCTSSPSLPPVPPNAGPSPAHIHHLALLPAEHKCRPGSPIPEVIRAGGQFPMGMPGYVSWLASHGGAHQGAWATVAGAHAGASVGRSWGSQTLPSCPFTPHRHHLTPQVVYPGGYARNYRQTGFELDRECLTLALHSRGCAVAPGGR